MDEKNLDAYDNLENITWELMGAMNGVIHARDGMIDDGLLGKRDIRKLDKAIKMIDESIDLIIDIDENVVEEVK